jgi:large subunit ribosomal protein L22
MEVAARYKNLRMSPRKVRLLLQPIRGRPVEEAIAVLQNADKPVGRKLAKLVRSAVANAEHNYQMDPDELRVKAAFADEGTRLHRYRPGPRGRIKPWTRRFSHVTVIVEEKE